jgi:hypothetical protein
MNWMNSNQTGYELGDPIADPRDPKGNEIGNSGHRQAPYFGSIYYSLGEQNCVWWAAIMLKQSGISVNSGVFDKIAAYNGSIGGASQVLNGTRSAFLQNKMPVFNTVPGFYGCGDVMDISSGLSTLGGF